MEKKQTWIPLVVANEEGTVHLANLRLVSLSCSVCTCRQRSKVWIVIWNVTQRLGESPALLILSCTAVSTGVLLFEIRVKMGGNCHPRLNIYEVIDSKEVPWGKFAKYSGKRVKQNWNRSEVSGWSRITKYTPSRRCVWRTVLYWLVPHFALVLCLGQTQWSSGNIVITVCSGNFTCPVLKHGPRSLVFTRVEGTLSLRRIERDCW